MALTVQAALVLGVALCGVASSGSVNVRPRAAEEKWSWTNLYEGCASTKNCLGIPGGCIRATSCEGLVTVQAVEGKYIFRMKAVKGVWVGAGLGTTNQMSDLSVIECVNYPSGTVQAYLSQTPKKAGSPTRLSDEMRNAAIDLTEHGLIDGGFYCEVTRGAQTNSNGTTVDLDKNEYFLMVASGTNATSTSIGYHHETKTAAARATRMGNYVDISPSGSACYLRSSALPVIALIWSSLKLFTNVMS